MKAAWITRRIAVALSAYCAAGCTKVHHHPTVEQAGTYHVHRLHESLNIDAKWDKPAWRRIPALELTHFMGRQPAHVPRIQAKLAYDDRFLYVIFRADDRYVRAVTPKNQGSVCHDSCVEFFFTPGVDVSAGYFNLEINCGGTLLFNFQPVPGKDVALIQESDLQRLEVAHSLPQLVESEIQEPTTWIIEYRLPTDLLARYCPTATRPGPGVTWRANLYKCADQTSHPHWLTWAKVDFPRPNFHLPQYFGRLIFE